MLTILNAHCEVVFVDRFHRLDWSLQVPRIRAAAARYNSARLACDVTGVGDPIYELLRKAGCAITPYPFTQKSKSDLVENLALMIEQRTLVLPRAELWPEGVEELESYEFCVTDAGKHAHERAERAARRLRDGAGVGGLAGAAGAQRHLQAVWQGSVLRRWFHRRGRRGREGRERLRPNPNTSWNDLDGFARPSVHVRVAAMVRRATRNLKKFNQDPLGNCRVARHRVHARTGDHWPQHAPSNGRDPLPNGARSTAKPPIPARTRSTTLPVA